MKLAQHIGRVSAAGARYRRDRRGSAAAEIAIWATALVVPVFGVADIGFYTYRKMQVEIAAQAAAAKAWQLCSTSTTLPAVKNCTGLLAGMNTALQGTNLGTGVTVSTGWPLEGYYCVNASNVLTPVSTVVTIGATPSAPPADCTATRAGSTAPPGDYLQVRVTYTFTPPYSGLSVTSLLPSPITKTAWMRLN
jgi:Flp pilus assembly protein TadG